MNVLSFCVRCDYDNGKIELASFLKPAVVAEHIAIFLMGENVERLAFFKWRFVRKCSPNQFCPLGRRREGSHMDWIDRFDECCVFARPLQISLESAERFLLWSHRINLTVHLSVANSAGT